MRFDVTGDTFPTGMQLATVEVDDETGTVNLSGYWTVNDCGMRINPLVVDGQIHGGLVQSMGPALFEQIVYDDEGQLITGSFIDYAMPKADSFPWFEVAHLETPSPNQRTGCQRGGRDQWLRAIGSHWQRGCGCVVGSGSHASQSPLHTDEGLADHPGRTLSRQPPLVPVPNVLFLP